MNLTPAHVRFYEERYSRPSWLRAMKPSPILSVHELVPRPSDFDRHNRIKGLLSFLKRYRSLGQGDNTGLHHGTQPQNFAQLDRFSMVGLVDYPSREVERKILALKVGVDSDAMAKYILDVAGMVREAFVKGEIMVTMSTRTVANVAQKIIDFGSIPFAYEVAFINKLNPDDKEFVKEIVQRVYGSAAA